MLFFTSDLHFSHEKIIQHTHRPFKNAEEMNAALIENWNRIVTPDDEVYILGDFTMKGAAAASQILCSLKGKKHLIKGNHDRFTDSPHFDPSLFASIQFYKEILYCNTLFILFHYPITEWNGIYRGSVSLHGHQHNSKQYNLENLKKPSSIRRRRRREQHEARKRRRNHPIFQQHRIKVIQTKKVWGLP